MIAELESLDEKDTWHLIELLSGKRIIGSKWVFKIKVDGRNSFEGYKSRVVAFGYLQEFEIDFDETFALVVRIDTVRCLFAIAAYYGLEIILVNCTFAFLHGDSDFEVSL